RGNGQAGGRADAVSEEQAGKHQRYEPCTHSSSSRRPNEAPFIQRGSPRRTTRSGTEPRYHQRDHACSRPPLSSSHAPLLPCTALQRTVRCALLDNCLAPDTKCVREEM